LRSWHFDVWSYEEDALLPLLEEMFRDFGLIDKFQMPVEKLRHFLVEMKHGYSNKNPYHNFRHAFDVTQACYLFLTTAGAAEFFTHLEITSLLFAALCHDFEHPGLNNNFQITTYSPLAILYNDHSILENYHLAKTFQLTRKPENNFLVNLSEPEHRELRKLVINCVLATDIARHVEITAKFGSILETFSRENKEHRHMLLEILLKCADISNPTRPLHLADYWSQMVQEEFFAQGDLEKQKRLNTSPFMDVEHAALPKMSVNFIDFLVTPLYSSLAKLLPSVSECCDRLLETRAKWASLLAEEEAKTS